MQKLSGDIALVTLPEEPQISEKLKQIIDTVAEDDVCHVVLDFSHVEILTSSSLSNLIVLRDLLRKSDRRLIFCSVSTPAKCIFRVVGLEKLFQFCNDKMMALEELEHSKHAEPSL